MFKLKNGYKNTKMNDETPFNEDNPTNDVKTFTSLDEPLTTTTNTLADIIRWLKAGAYIVIHSKNGRFFHKCTKTTLTTHEVKNYLDNHRFIYINVSKLPGLLDNGEWNWYITHAGFDECKCSLKDISSKPGNIPHKDMMSI